MAYVSVDDMMAYAWESKAVVDLKLSAAIANIRSKLVAGIPLVTRERTTYSKYVVRPPSSYVCYRESLPILPDPLLQDYLAEDLSFSENKGYCQTMAEVLAPDTSDEPRARGNSTRTRSQRTHDNSPSEFLLVQLWKSAPASGSWRKQDDIVQSHRSRRP